MPFTLAHPAAALPARRALGRLGCASALVVGSMVPDLVYFVPLGVSGAQSHSLLGLAWFCLPVGALVWLTYARLLQPFALAVLPRGVSERVRRPAAPTEALPLVASVATSIVAGAITHVLWDSFTHSSGFAVSRIAWLQTAVPLFDGYAPQVHTLLQHASSLLGLSLLALWSVRWYVRACPAPELAARVLPGGSRALVVGALTVPTLVAGAVVLLMRLGPNPTFHTLQLSLGRAIFAAGSVFLVAITLGALAWHVAAGRMSK